MITARDLIDDLEQTNGVSFVERGGRLHVIGLQRLSTTEQVVVAANRIELLSCLRGNNRPLKARDLEREIERLGLMRMDNGAITHPSLGDEYAERIAVGLITSTEAEAEATGRRDQLRAMQQSLKRGTFKHASWAD